MNIDPFGEEDWEFDEEDEQDDINDGDWVIFPPNHHYTYNNNFAVKKIIHKYEDGVSLDAYGEDFIFEKYYKYMYKLFDFDTMDLKKGDYFFFKKNSDLKYDVNVVTGNEKDTVYFDIQPLNYNGGIISINTALVPPFRSEFEVVLVPGERVKKLLDKKINRIKRKRTE